MNNLIMGLIIKGGMNTRFNEQVGLICKAQVAARF